MEDELLHYGILGMKWGIRRTPEQLGHKKAQSAKNTLQKYKDQKVSKINKMYAKSIKKTKEALEYDPENKDLKKQLEGLEELRKKDIDKIDRMSYTDVVNERRATKEARIAKTKAVIGDTAKAVGATTLWAARMGLVGVRIYGTFKAAELVGELGMRAVRYLNSPEGQEIINKGYHAIETFVRVGDSAAKLANPDLGRYVDANKLADTIIDYGKDYAREQLGNLTRHSDDSTALYSWEYDSNYLEHYGILGMKWGVRRTPEQLGHKKAEKGQQRLRSYKDKKISRIERMYKKSLKQTKKDLEYDPNNKDLKKQLKSLNKLKEKDISSIESMSYSDMVKEQRQAASARKKVIMDVGKAGLYVAGSYATYTVLREVVGPMAISWLNSRDGTKLADLGKANMPDPPSAGNFEPSKPHTPSDSSGGGRFNMPSMPNVPSSPSNSSSGGGRFNMPNIPDSAKRPSSPKRG